jgi:hypothetical protein
MNGKVSKRLRRIARELKLNPQTEYAPVGDLVRLPERRYIDKFSGEEKVLPGGVLRRPLAMTACERRAYHEAKEIYLGRA